MKKILAMLFCAVALCASAIAPEDGKKVKLSSGAEMTIFSPANPDGRAVVAYPGGAYFFVSMGNEGFDAADWMLDNNITYAVVNYTLPAGNRELPLNDAWEAVRYIKSNAAELKVDPKKVGVMGSSAGGHLAATVSTIAPDPESRPAFTILLYPVISMWDDANVHKGSRDNLLGKNADEQTLRHYSPDLRVDSMTPPAFIVLCGDDDIVEPINGLRYYMALQEKGINASIHIYPTGKHGFGWLDRPFKKVWTDDLGYWLETLK
ncbi:MAG: alpha/beta hydrolase [Bacteroidales bacterium]|nr:alpha/beta hydrolase [Bacteroidales bacterium]